MLARMIGEKYSVLSFYARNNRVQWFFTWDFASMLYWKLLYLFSEKPFSACGRKFHPQGFKIGQFFFKKNTRYFVIFRGFFEIFRKKVFAGAPNDRIFPNIQTCLKWISLFSSSPFYLTCRCPKKYLSAQIFEGKFSRFESVRAGVRVLFWLIRKFQLSRWVLLKVRGRRATMFLL